MSATPLRDGRSLLPIVLAAVVAAGCAPTIGEVLADGIRSAQSPMIREVDYRRSNMLDPSEVDVWLQPEAAKVQANALSFELIAPARGLAIEGDRLVLVHYSDGPEFVSLNPVCVMPPI